MSRSGSEAEDPTIHGINFLVLYQSGKSLSGDNKSGNGKHVPIDY